ncbi:hypothetical protein KFK09_012699 [Dendrobium nobile]|uniref:Uncharacterized protein n=1 Tax=Dendrobium nobile TaxID=94219 RepID=A0A8T3BI67_DENNO|nr:hypothetical protein KFK09_012699 [Dendrobium nobile]
MCWRSFYCCDLLADVTEDIQLVVSECKPKGNIVGICEKGDAFIQEQAGSIYKNVKKKIERGVAFPSCISVNHTVCHFSPLWNTGMVRQFWRRMILRRYKNCLCMVLYFYSSLYRLRREEGFVHKPF